VVCTAIVLQIYCALFSKTHPNLKPACGPRQTPATSRIARGLAVDQVKESEFVIRVTALASRATATNGWSFRSWLSALGTMRNAANGF
jgi:hypothetical protein